MRVHILGICGTFMAGIAQIARQSGHQVTGSDAATYPPMSTLLAEQGIEVMEGYRAENVPANVDVCIIGNAMSRGNEEVEHILDSALPYTSGPEWLFRHVLADRQVIAVAGTHGKTTTTSMICQVLESAGLQPGFLVGGVPGNFQHSARLGRAPWFVIEADEYDTAFFDKRSKFVHYHPRIAVLNNLEFDHADIFRSLDDIQTQVHHLVRTVPRSGTLVVNHGDAHLRDTLARGCWSRLSPFVVDDSDAPAGSWRLLQGDEAFGQFAMAVPDGGRIEVDWSLFGAHNAANALAAAAACHAAGITPEEIAAGLASFMPPRRRLQQIGHLSGAVLYEDFAHHPTAIAATLQALKARHPGQRIIAVLELRSNTMQAGVHREELARVLSVPNLSLVLRGPRMAWDPASLGERCEVHETAADIVARLEREAGPADVVVLMSNGGFQSLPSILTGSQPAVAEPSSTRMVNEKTA